jgi:hypothetical protein
MAADETSGGEIEPSGASGRRLTQLLREDVLCRYPCCPVCASSRRRPVPDTAGDNRYIRAIPLVAPISPSEVLDLLRVHRCEECSSAYCDPWLSRRVSALLYASGFGQHYGGWQIFHASVADSDVATHAYWQAKTWARIREVAGPISGYAELNCPFGGLLTYFRRSQSEPGEYRRLARRVERGLRSRRRHPEGVASTVRRIFDRRAPARTPRAARPGALDVPGERVLVVEPSSACWGTNCISRGVSCRSVAPELLDAAVVTSEDLRREALRFDVAVLTQLDHFFSPMQVLDRFLDISKLVVVLCHLSDRFTRQHLFAFGPGAAAYLAQRGYYAVDATRETIHPSKRRVNQCLFVSKQIRM